jgi:hypothetical protein
MGEIKRQIRKLSREAGGKLLARKKAHSWYTTGKNKRSERSVASTGQRFRPGKIYVFEYKTPKGIDRLEWWDRNPVVLALDPYKGNDVGINLNLLPIGVKEELLDFVYDRMAGQIKSKTMGSSTGDAKLQGQIGLSYGGAKGFLKRYGFDFAIRQYIPNLKSNQAVVAYENWANIALCDFIDLNGTTVGKVKAMFRKHLGS